MQDTVRRYRLYTGSAAHGAPDCATIQVFDFDNATGELEWVGNDHSVNRPTWLALHPEGHRLYAISAVGDDDTGQPGALVAFAVDGKSGALTPLHRQPCGGAGPAYVAVHRYGRFAAVANYRAGSVAILPIAGDGGLLPVHELVQLDGCGPSASRQEKSHAHMTLFGPDGDSLFVPDLGSDRLMQYRLEPTGRLVPASPPAVATAPGAGPRHLRFHPNGRVAYLVNELDSTLVVLRYGGRAGMLEPIATHALLPPGYVGESYAAEVRISPDARWLYASNRGHDSLIRFAVEDEGERLLTTGYSPSGGSYPRGFAIDPSGGWLLCANQQSDNLVVNRIDPDSGELTERCRLALPQPVCVLFANAVD